MFSTKRGATSLALIVILGLVILKFAIAFLSGSISIFAQTADSFLDVIAVLIAFFSIRIFQLFSFYFSRAELVAFLQEREEIL